MTTVFVALGTGELLLALGLRRRVEGALLGPILLALMGVADLLDAG